jgi:hypothetical protein
VCNVVARQQGRHCFGVRQSHNSCASHQVCAATPTQVAASDARRAALKALDSGVHAALAGDDFDAALQGGLRCHMCCRPIEMQRTCQAATTGGNGLGGVGHLRASAGSKKFCMKMLLLNSVISQLLSVQGVLTCSSPTMTSGMCLAGIEKRLQLLQEEGLTNPLFRATSCWDAFRCLCSSQSCSPLIPDLFASIVLQHSVRG